MTGLSFLRQMLRHLASSARLDAVNAELRAYGIEHPLGARGVHDLASQAEGFREDLQQARAGWDKALDIASASTDLTQELIAERDQLLTALRAAVAGQRERAAMCNNKASERQNRERREHELTATTLEAVSQFVEGDRYPLYLLLPSWRWTDEMVQAFKEDGEKP